MKGRRSASGYTLVELVTVVAVIGVLSAVAYPSYTGYVQRSNRAAAKSALEQVAQFMERQFTIKNAYPDASALSASGFAVVPVGATGGEIKYDVTISAVTPTSFTITATPASSKIDPTCNILSMDNIGNRTSSSGVAAECWGR
ncbi:MAG: type IV pilin protein [Betaproteobacteria bacterium]|jgi:type IV pilus assembly protein PilE|nr:type IV pilin protein [Betaproteobacteria bacterium]